MGAAGLIRSRRYYSAKPRGQSVQELARLAGRAAVGCCVVLALIVHVPVTGGAHATGVLSHGLNQPEPEDGVWTLTIVRDAGCRHAEPYCVNGDRGKCIRQFLATFERTSLTLTGLPGFLVDLRPLDTRFSISNRVRYFVEFAHVSADPARLHGAVAFGEDFGPTDDLHVFNSQGPFEVEPDAIPGRLNGTMGMVFAGTACPGSHTAEFVRGLPGHETGRGFTSRFSRDALGWIAVRGGWRVTRGALTIQLAQDIDGGRQSPYWIGREGTYEDFSYSAKMRMTPSADGREAGLIVRAGSSRGDLFFGHRRDGAWSVQLGSGQIPITTLARGAVPGKPREWTVLRVVGKKHRLKFYIDGSRVWSGRQRVPETGNVGLWAASAGERGELRIDWARLKMLE